MVEPNNKTKFRFDIKNHLEEINIIEIFLRITINNTSQFLVFIFRYFTFKKFMIYIY